MKIFYDGTSLTDLTLLEKKGLVSGVTTNLTFIANECRLTGQNPVALYDSIQQFCDSKKLPLSIQTSKSNSSEIYKEAKDIVARYKGRQNDIYIKIPVEFELLEAIHQLSSEGILINATAVCNLNQAIVAAHAGAKIVSLFWGKLSDEGGDCYEITSSFSEILKTTQLQSQILVGSIRTPANVYQAFSSGANIVTLPAVNFEKISNSLKAKEAQELFHISWNGLGSTW